MNKYFTRACPRCNGQVGIIIRQPENPAPLRAVNGRCLECSYRLAWIVIDGKRSDKRRRIPPMRRKRQAL